MLIFAIIARLVRICIACWIGMMVGEALGNLLYKINVKIRRAMHR